MTDDQKIQALQDKIAEKKKAISYAENPNYRTPMTGLEIFGKTYNLHATNLNGLKMLRVFLQMMVNVAVSTGDLDIIISGNTLPDWLNDVGAKIDNLNIAAERQRLNKMQHTLDSLLSDEARRQRELERIEKELL